MLPNQTSKVHYYSSSKNTCCCRLCPKMPEFFNNIWTSRCVKFLKQEKGYSRHKNIVFSTLFSFCFLTERSRCVTSLFGDFSPSIKINTFCILHSSSSHNLQIIATKYNFKNALVKGLIFKKISYLFDTMSTKRRENWERKKLKLLSWYDSCKSQFMPGSLMLTLCLYWCLSAPFEACGLHVAFLRPQFLHRPEPELLFHC